MVAHGGESPTRKANTRRHVVYAPVPHKQEKNKNEIIRIDYFDNKHLLLILYVIQDFIE